MRSAVLTLAVALMVGCAPSPALPDRSAVRAELRGLIDDVLGSTAYRYQLKAQGRRAETGLATGALALAPTGRPAHVGAWTNPSA
jgi:hypothetical protein